MKRVNSLHLHLTPRCILGIGCGTAAVGWGLALEHLGQVDEGERVYSGQREKAPRWGMREG